MNLTPYPALWLAAAAAILLLQPAWSDTLMTTNGSSISGEIRAITLESVIIQTDFAGEITIDRLQVTQLMTESPLTLELADGSEVTALAELTEDGDLRLRNDDIDRRVPADQLVSARIPGAYLPEDADGDPDRHWKYSIAADLNGKRGNAEEMGTMIRTEAVLNGDNEIKLYASMDRGKTNGIESSDEIILGSSYVIYTHDPWGWFVNAELERDRFESIDLRTNVSTGLSYRLLNRPGHTLQLQTGIGYRHESYTDNTSDDTPTLDIGLEHALTIASWMEMTNTLSFVPSVTDFSDYQFVQDSGLTMPIGNTDLSIRLGIKNNYNKVPAAGRERLDTIYYSRLLMNFD